MSPPGGVLQNWASRAYGCRVRGTEVDLLPQNCIVAAADGYGGSGRSIGPDVVVADDPIVGEATVHALRIFGAGRQAFASSRGGRASGGCMVTRAPRSTRLAESRSQEPASAVRW